MRARLQGVGTHDGKPLKDGLRQESSPGMSRLAKRA